MSLLDLFRSPSAPAEKKSVPAAPVKQPSPDTFSAAVAVAEPPGPTPEQLEEARKEAARREENERLASLKSAVVAEFVPLDEVLEQFRDGNKRRTSAEVLAEIELFTKHSKDLAARHKASIADLLPVEDALKQTLEDEYRKRSQLVNTRLTQLQTELIEAKLDEKYRRIDMLGVMNRRKWSDKHQCALPLYAMFNVNASVCTLEAHATRRYDYDTPQSWMLSNPQQLVELCPTVAQTLSAENQKDMPAWTSRARCISARFAGAIPAEIRKEIALARGDFEDIFLVTEAPEWELEQFQVNKVEGVRTRLHTPPIPQRDPLVIGLKLGKYWHIADFDLTPAEEYVKKEFTFDKLSSQ